MSLATEKLIPFVDQGRVSSRYRTSKTCPGTLVNMDNIRQLIRNYGLEESAAQPSNFDKEVADALQILQNKKHLYPNAIDELTEFATHPEVMSLLEK